MKCEPLGEDQIHNGHRGLCNLSTQKFAEKVSLNADWFHLRAESCCYPRVSGTAQHNTYRTVVLQSIMVTRKWILTLESVYWVEEHSQWGSLLWMPIEI